MNALRIAMGLTIAALLASALVAVAQERGPADNQQAPGAENALHAPKSPADQTPTALCPVTGKPANLAVSVATDDGPVFFCCEACEPKFKADPDKYAAKVAAQRKALADRPKVQVLCPVSREQVDSKVFTEYKGTKVHFCCKGCIDKFLADPDKYRAALANSYTYQVKCPVTGEDIDPQARVGKIYFCCKSCDKKFSSNIDKYAPNLEAQGYRFDAGDMKHETPPPGGAHDNGSSGHEHGGVGHGH